MKLKNLNNISGGIADNKSIDDLANHHLQNGIFFANDPKKWLIGQLKAGIKVELEHTNDKKIATEIAMDHLWEDPSYYKKLHKMETESVAPAASTGGTRTSPKKASIDRADITDKNGDEVPNNLKNSNNQQPILKEPNDKLKPVDSFGPGDR